MMWIGRSAAVVRHDRLVEAIGLVALSIGHLRPVTAVGHDDDVIFGCDLDEPVQLREDPLPRRLLVEERDDLPPDIAEKGTEIRGLLKLPAAGQKFTLTYSPMRGTENELAVNSRSTKS